MSVPILEVVDLHAAYGRIEVLRGVDLAVPKGAVMALLGPNGAGKTTLVKVVSGQKKPTARRHPPRRRPRPGRRARGAGPGRAVHDPRGPLGLPEPHRRGEPHPDVVRRGAGRGVLETAYTYFPRLQERRSQLAGTMSGGEQQMLAMSRALASDPALLLLDELSMGLAPLIVDELYETVAEIAAERGLDPRASSSSPAPRCGSPTTRR